MLKNYFTIAFRNLARHKGFTFINVAGLTLGLTACLLIGLFVYDELQYDKFIPEGDRIYRIYNDVHTTKGNQLMVGTPPMFAPTLRQELPEVETSVRVLQILAKGLVETGEKKVYEDNGVVADSTFFEVFRLPFVHGSPEQALHSPSSMVVSDDFARRVFGEIDPVGQEIAVNKQKFVVMGVFKSNPKFHLPVNYILPMTSVEIPAERMQRWTWQQFNTYVKLKAATDVDALQAKFREIVKERADPKTREINLRYVPHFQPLREIYLYSAGFDFDMATKGNILFVRALSIIAVFVLLIASFNFVNLSTAKSTQRAKEVGVRKAIGATRSQLMLQFMGETVLLSLISVIFAASLTSLFLPKINAFTGKELTFNLPQDPILLLVLLFLALLVGVLAGFYPALVLSGYKPVRVLKGAVVSETRVGKVQWLRHGLIVVQFAVSIFLIVSAAVVFKQVSFLHSKDLGFNREQIMFFPMQGQHMSDNYETFKHELLQSPGVASVSVGYGFPGDFTAVDGIIVPKDGEQRKYTVTQLMVDFDYIPTLDVQLVAGRAFSKAYGTDADQAFMLNETAVRELGFGTPEQALGQPLLWNTWDESNPDSLKAGTVIGVVKDFHYKSLYDKVEPTVLQIYPDAYWKVAVKMKSVNIGESIDHVKRVWHTFSPEFPIEYIFLDDTFQKMYEAEDKLKTLLSLFTGIAIFIACLGLFGLAAYAAERRKKEIGIRKILGAQTSSIVTLLSKEFMQLIVVATVLAFPLAWYAMHRWLQDFAYRIDIPWWVFLAAGAVATTVAFLTISFQAFKAATADPTRNLRTD